MRRLLSLSLTSFSRSARKLTGETETGSAKSSLITSEGQGGLLTGETPLLLSFAHALARGVTGAPEGPV